ncbi:flagellar brake protein [Anoxynatronum sibiricum]|uniref:Flagellar brake protein n=1 Tax=Anoxynatronum sibiricum TaxID=210623 RepID=A0ABU9VV51_9CLOT
MNLELLVSEKVNMEVTNRNTGETLVLKSLLLEQDEETLYLAVPIHRGVEYVLHQGQQMKVVYYRENGVFSLQTRFLQKVKLGEVEACRLVIDGKPVKMQRRDYFRLPCLLTARLKSLSTGVISRVTFDEVEAIIHDISGSGARGISHKPFAEKDQVICTLFLDPEELTVKAEIIRCQHQADERQYELGMRFSEISETQQDQLLAFILNRQRNLRQKGLL